MKTIKLPNGRMARFPDDATQEEIQQAIGAYMATVSTPAAPPPPSLPRGAFPPPTGPDVTQMPSAPLTQVHTPTYEMGWAEPPVAYGDTPTSSAAALLASGRPVTERQVTQSMGTATPEQYAEMQRRIYSYNNPNAPPDVRLRLAQEATANQPPSSATYWAERAPFVGGFAAAAEPLSVAMAARRIQDGKASSEDYLTVGQYMNDQKYYENRGVLGKAFDVVGMAPAIAVEAFAAAPSLGASAAPRVAGTATKVAGKIAAKEAIKNTIESLTSKAVRQHIGEAAGKVATAGLRNTFVTGSGRTVKGTADRLAAGDSLPSAFAMAATQQFIESASERIGDFIPPNAIESGLGSWLASKTKSMTGMDPAKGMELLRKGGVHSFMGELVEERAAEIASGAVLGEGEYGLTGDVVRSFTADTPEARAEARKQAVEQLSVEFLAWVGMAAGGTVASSAYRQAALGQRVGERAVRQDERAQRQAAAEQVRVEGEQDQSVVSWFEESDQEAARQMQEAARQRQEQLKQTFDRKNPTVSQKRQATDFRSMSPAAFLDRYPETAAELAKLPDNISRSQFANAVGVPTSVVGKNGRQRMNEFVAAARDIAAQKLRQPPFPESQLPPLPAEMGGDPNLEPAAGINAAQLQNLSNAELQALYGGSQTKNKKDNIKAIAPDAPRQAAPPKSVIRDFDDLTSDQFAAKYPDKAQAAEALRTMPLNEIKKQLGLKRSTNRRDVLNMLLNTGERSLPQQQQQPAPAPPVAQQPVVEQVAPAPPIEQVAPPVEPEQPAPVTAAPPPPQPTLSQAAREVLAQLSNEDTDGLLALADMFKVKLPKKGTKAHKEMTDDVLREMVAVAMTSGKGVGSIDLGGSTPAATSAEPTPSPQEPSMPAEAPAPAPPAKSARESWKEAKAARNQAKKQQRDNPPAAEPPPQKVPDRNAKNAITGVKLTPEQRTQLKENLKGLSKQDRVAYWENARHYKDPLHLYHPRAFALAQTNYVLDQGTEKKAAKLETSDYQNVIDSAREYGYSKDAQKNAADLFLAMIGDDNRSVESTQPKPETPPESPPDAGTPAKPKPPKPAPKPKASKQSQEKAEKDPPKTEPPKKATKNKGKKEKVDAEAYSELKNTIGLVANDLAIEGTRESIEIEEDAGEIEEDAGSEENIVILSANATVYGNLALLTEEDMLSAGVEGPRPYAVYLLPSSGPGIHLDGFPTRSKALEYIRLASGIDPLVYASYYDIPDSAFHLLRLVKFWTEGRYNRPNPSQENLLDLQELRDAILAGPSKSAELEAARQAIRSKDVVNATGDSAVATSVPEAGPAASSSGPDRLETPAEFAQRSQQHSKVQGELNQLVEANKTKGKTQEISIGHVDGSEQKVQSTVYGPLAVRKNSVRGQTSWEVYVVPLKSLVGVFNTPDRARRFVRIATLLDEFAYPSVDKVPRDKLSILADAKRWAQNEYEYPEYLDKLVVLRDAIAERQKPSQVSEKAKADLPKQLVANNPAVAASEPEFQRATPKLSRGDIVSNRGFEAKVLIPDLGPQYTGDSDVYVRIQMLEGPQKGQFVDDYQSGLDVLKPEDTKAGKAAAAKAKEEADQLERDRRVTAQLVDSVSQVARKMAASGIDLSPRTKKAKQAVLMQAALASGVRNDKILQDAIDIVAAEQQRAAVTAPPPAKKASKAVLAAAKQDAKVATEAADDVLEMSNGHTAVLRSGMLYETELVPSTWTNGRIGYSETGVSMPVKGAGFKDDAYYTASGATTDALKQGICDAIAKKAGFKFKIKALSQSRDMGYSSIDLPFISKHTTSTFAQSGSGITDASIKPAAQKRLAALLDDIQRFLNRLPIASAGLQRVTVDLFATDNKALRGFAYKNHIFLSRAALLNNEVDVVWGLVGHELAHATSIDRLHELFGENLVKEFSAKYYKKTSQWYRDLLDQDPTKLYREGVAQLIQEFMSNAKFRDSLMKKEPKGWAWLVEKFFQLFGLADDANQMYSPEMKKAAEKIRELFNSSNYDNSDRMLFSDVDDSLFSIEADASLQEKLDSEPTIKVYRAMQLIDGKLYPVMSAKVDGKLRNPTKIGVWEVAEERPDLVNKDGKFKLAKATKSSPVMARYNPYFHTSRSPLNDQFASAYDRPNLVTVEVEVPASELTSGYHAKGAKDAVGEMSWNTGPVSGKLPKHKERKVILSRYAKVTRIVPDAEVAQVIAKLLEGEGLSIPAEVVTPSLRQELERVGVKIDDPVMFSAEEDLDTAAERVKKKLATQVKRRAISVMQKYARRAVREVLSKDKSTPPPPPEMLAAAAERQLKAAMAELEQMTPVPGFTIKPAREFDMEVMAEYLRRRPDGYNEYASKYTKPPFQSPNYESWPSREFRRQAKAASAAPPLNREEQRARVQRAFGRANPATTVAGRQKILEMDMRLGPAEARPRQEAIEMAAARTAGKGMRKETDAFLERFRSGNFSPLPHEADYIVLRSILDEATVGQAMQGGDQALEDLLLLHKGYRDSRSELARNLSLRDPIARDPATRIRRAINHSIFDQTNIPLIKKIMDALEKEGIDINSPEFAESLELAARALAIILGVKKRESQGPVHSYFDMQYEFYLNSIMSGMQTQVANVAGNAFNIVWTNGIERTVEVVVSKATRGKLSDDQQVRDFRELGEMYKAMGGAIGTALANAKMAWKHEYSPINLLTDHRNEFSDMTRASFAIPGKAGRMVRAFGFRQLAFADEFFRTIAAHGAAAVQAYRLSKQHGIADDDLNRFIAGHVGDYSSPVWQAAMAEADLQTFQQQGGEISGAFKQSASWLKDKVPGVRYVVPFSNFLVNSFSRAAELTPGLGLAVAAFNGSRESKVNWNRVAAQQLLAMGLYAAISAVADDRDEDGLPTITGTKEFNNGRRGLQYMTAPPMSVKIGGRYYSYARIEPLNTMLSAAVDFADGVASGDNVAGSLPASFFRQVDDKNYMQSIEDLLKIFRSEEPGRETADYAGSLAVGFVPNIYRQAKREIRNVVTDTTSKKGDDLATYAKRMMMKAELPGIGYAYRYDIWGRPMQTNAPSTWAVYRILSPIKVKDRADVLPVNAAIVRWNEKMEAENRDDERISTEIPRYPKVGNVRITMEEYEQYAREAGKYAYDAVKDRKFPVNMTQAHAKGIEDALQRGREIALYRLKKRLADGK